MNVLKLPFNEFLGLQLSDKAEYLLMLDQGRQYHNHLETIHASALFGLAEPTSGYFLLQEFGDIPHLIPVVRKVETRYRKPAIGKIYSKAKFIGTTSKEVQTHLEQKGRVLVKVEASLYDQYNVLVMESIFEWFVTVKV